MASEEAGDTVKRETLDVIRKLTRVLSGLRFTFDVSRLTEVL